MSESQRVGMIGLGLMGTAITERLIEFGFSPCIWNRTREKADALIARGAVWSENPFVECRRTIISLYTSEIVRAVVDRMKSGLQPGDVLIDTTTGEPADCELMGRELQARGVQYLDAPISGSSEQTRRGEAMVIVGSDSATFERCRDLWPVLGKTVIHAGPCGAASKMKLISNLVLGLNRAALAEGLAFAKSMGVDTAAALEMLKQSAAYSRTMDTKGAKMISGDFTVQARLAQHHKDVRIILQLAQEVGLELPLSLTHDQLLMRAESAGLGELDNSAIYSMYGTQQND